MGKQLFIYGEISSQLPLIVAEFLEKNKNAVEIRINSGGGNVFSGLAICNLLKKHGNATVYVDGIAASAATLILMGAKKIICAKNSLIMIHDPMVELGGDVYTADELEKLKNSLDSIKNSLIETYTARLQKTPDEIAAFMTQEKYLTAKEALELGLIDEISGDEVEMKLSADKSVMYINSVAIKTENLPEVKKVEENTDTKQIMSKYKASILTAEKMRILALLTILEPSPLLDIVKNAIEKNNTIDDIKPYLNLAQAQKPPVAQVEPQIKNLDELYKLLKDNLTSGAENVQVSSPPPDKNEKQLAQADLIAKFTNQALKGGVR